jgi:hypothetical protein
MGEGKTALSLTDDSWFIQFRNNMSGVLVPYVPIGDLFDRLVRACVARGSVARIDRKQLTSIKLLVDDRLHLVRRSTTGHFRVSVKVGRKSRPFYIGDVVSCFIFVTDDDNYWVIPRNVLIEKGYIGASEGDGRENLTLHRQVKWANPYLRNDMLLWSI